MDTIWSIPQNVGREGRQKNPLSAFYARIRTGNDDSLKAYLK
jgi:hypothetical protein